MSGRTLFWWVISITLSTTAIGCRHAAVVDEHEPVVAVHCASPTRQPVDESVALRGRTEPPPGGDLPVASQVPGRIVQVDVIEGQHVARGDVVASVDDVASRDALRQADAAVVQAKATLANANVTLDRTKALVAKGIAPKQELDDATARADGAKAGVDASIAAADLARRTLGRVVVRSTFDGIVTKVWRGAGALVDGTSSTPIVQLAAADHLEFLADATEQELSSIAVAQTAQGELVAQGQASPFTGVVLGRSSAIDPTTGLGFVRITLAPGTKASVGAYGRVVVAVGHREGVLVVPTTAIRGSVSDGVEIALCLDGKAEVRTVSVGYRDAKVTEIVKGLDDKERVAIDHVLGLETGTAIEELP